MKLLSHEDLYTYGLYTSYVLFALTSLGLWTAGADLLSKLDFALNFYVAVFLIYNFNPYSTKRVSQFGRGIAFSAGVLLLLTKGLVSFITPEQGAKEHSISEIVYDMVEWLKASSKFR